jgi:hypothetical protein
VVKEAFEIKAAYKTGHEPGLVVVLDRAVSRQPAELTGSTAAIRTPSGNLVRVRIDEAKDHLAATSLFFRHLNPGDVPAGSVVEISDEKR